MTLSLDTVKPKNSLKKSRRRGRGDASGRGTYSGRGLKGQNARSGSSGLAFIGIKDKVRQTPKKRGFKSGRPKNQIVKTEILNKNFKEGETVNPERLFSLGIVSSKNQPVKILAGSEELKVKKLVLKGLKISEKVQGQLEKAGGKLED